MKACFNGVKISGISVCVPPNKIDIDDNLDLFNGDIKALNRIKKISGVQTRYICDDSIGTADLGLFSSKNLLKMLEFDKNKIDIVIFVTQTPDFFMPSCAGYLHHKLQLSSKAIAFDVNQACAGYLYGLFIIFSFMQQNDSINNALLVCGDTLSKTIKQNNPTLAPIYGDGVSATLIQKDNLFTDKSFFSLYFDGSGFDKLMVANERFVKLNKNKIQNDNIFNDDRDIYDMYMDGATIFNKALFFEPQSVEEILNYSCKSKDEIDYFIFHQSNKFLVDNIARDLDINTDKVPNFLMAKYANLSACSIPATLCELEKNDINVVLSAFGAGYSWGSAFLKLDKNFKVDKISIYKDEV